MDTDWCHCGRAITDGASYCSNQCRDYEQPSSSSFPSSSKSAAERYTQQHYIHAGPSFQSWRSSRGGSRTRSPSPAPSDASSHQQQQQQQPAPSPKYAPPANWLGYKDEEGIRAWAQDVQAGRRANHTPRPTRSLRRTGGAGADHTHHHESMSSLYPRAPVFPLTAAHLAPPALSDPDDSTSLVTPRTDLSISVPDVKEASTSLFGRVRSLLKPSNRLSHPQEAMDEKAMVYAAAPPAPPYRPCATTDAIWISRDIEPTCGGSKWFADMEILVAQNNPHVRGRRRSRDQNEPVFAAVS